MTPRTGSDDELLTLRQLELTFRVDPRTATRWEAEGKLRAIRTSAGRLRFYRSDVISAMARALAERSDETKRLGDRRFEQSDAESFATVFGSADVEPEKSETRLVAHR